MKIPKMYNEAKYMEVDREIRKLAETQFKKGEGLYIYGKAGVGKTHIAYAIAKQLGKKDIKFIFEKVNDLMERLKRYDENEYIDQLKEVRGCLFLDDIGAEKTSEWVREKLLIILDYRCENKLPVFFTSNCNIKDLADKIGIRLSSRIAGMSAIIEKGGVDSRIK